MNDKKENKSMLKKVLPGVLVSVVVIAVLLKFVDWNVLKEALKNCSPKLFFTLFALQSIAFMFRGMAWRTILNKLPSPLNSFFTICEGYLLNLLPLRLGELGRAVIMGGLIRKSPFYVFSTVLLERLFDLIVTCIMIIVTIPLASGANISMSLYYVLFACIICGLIVLFWVARNQKKTMEILSKIIKPESKIGVFLLPKVQSFFTGMEILTQPKEFLVWLMWILLTWVCWTLTIITGMKSFFPEQPLWAGPFVQGLCALGGAIPSAPAGIGVIEGAYVVSLGFLGIDQSQGLAFGLVMHAISIISPVIWGLIGFSVQGLKFTEVFSNIQNTDLSESEKEDKNE